MPGFEFEATTRRYFCPSGTSNVDGVCTAFQSACDVAGTSFSLADNLQLGSTGTLITSLILPSGTSSASVTAVPLDSTVTAGTNIQGGAWSGEATLPSSDEWEIMLTIGSQTCTAKKTTLTVICKDGFVLDKTTKTCECPTGYENVDGVCTVSASLCDQAAPTLSLASNNALGSTSLLTASMTVPVGTAVALTANPLGSSVSVDQNSADSTTVWVGTATLPTVGSWSIALTIGSETCTIDPSAYPAVACMSGFVSNGAGRCECPTGMQNVNGVCTTVQSDCDLTTASFSLENSPNLGSNGHLVALLSTPGNKKALVTAVPSSSTVTAGSEGTATLPSTGLWDVSVTVGNEMCSKKSTQLTVVCIAGFVLDATTKTCNCPAGKQNVNGVCVMVQSACDKTITNFSLASDTALGSMGQLISSIKHPAGATADIAAVPLGSAEVPGTGLTDTWSGSATLPSTGKWQITVTVTSGSDSCTLQSTELSVVCLAGFQRNPTTKQCECPTGAQNINGVCQAAKSLCSQAQASFLLAKDTKLGSTGRLISNLTLPPARRHQLQQCHLIVQ